MKLDRAWGLMLGGLFLIVLYVVVAWRQDNFCLANYDYVADHKLMMFGIPIPFLQSQFWKLILLLPASFLLTIGLVRANAPLSVPEGLDRRTAVVWLLGGAALLLVLSTQLLFHETEVTDDENTYDFQAKTLLEGRVANPPPPELRNFDNVFIINDGLHWTGRYNLGHPAVIALGMMLGDRYVVTIALSILTLLLIYLIAGELYEDKRVALLALCLGSVSPFFYLVSSSRLSHTTTAFCLALFIYLFLIARRSNDLKRFALFSLFSGMSLGYAFNVRGLTALAFSLPMIVVMLMDLKRSPRTVMVKHILFVGGFSVIFFATLWYNKVITGSYLTFPFTYYEPRESLGFGSIGHTLGLALNNLAVSLTRINSVLFGFPVSLIFVLIFLFAKKIFGDWILLGIAGSMFFLYLFWYYPGVSDLGPVYYYELLIPLVLLSARGIFFVRDVLSRRFEHNGRPVLLFLLISVVIAAGSFVPERMTHIARLTKGVREPYKTIRAAGIHRAILFFTPFNYKGWVFSYRNPSPDFSDDVIFCRYADPVSNRGMMGRFPDRAAYGLAYNESLARYELFLLDPATGKAVPKHP